MSASVSINQGDASGALVVPREAIRSANGQTVVSAVDGNGQLHDVPVQVGRTLGGNVEIVSGVNEGDTVAVYATSTRAGPIQP